jgi:hypothetical protein
VGKLQYFFVLLVALSLMACTMIVFGGPIVLAYDLVDVQTLYLALLIACIVGIVSIYAVVHLEKYEC